MTEFMHTLVKQDDNGTITTTSLRIAEIFGKRHNHILRSIKELIQQLPQDFNEPNFGLVEYKDAKGELRPMYTLTRDAFSLLVMGFTGEKALQWKLKYIEAFNAMEQQLIQTHVTEISEQIKLTHEIAYQQGIDYAKSLPALEIETKKSYLQGLEEGKKLQKDTWQKMEKAIDLLAKGLPLSDTAKLVGLHSCTIRRRFQRLGLWEQVKNGDLWYNMPHRAIIVNKEKTAPEQLSLI